MNSEKILKNIGEIYSPLSIGCQQELVANFNNLTINKGEIVVREGQFSDKAYLIVQGCARAYYLKDGKDISDWFAFEDEFMASIVSFFCKEPSPHYIEFVEDSLVIEFSRDTIDRLCSKHHDFERLISKVVTKTMLGLRERLSSILFNKAEERYKQLINIRPDITNRIPLTHIASYLGITLETLSRIRNPKKRI
ncbi:Crp/Fnr family transcriptional regulator [Xanthovirga aplysinae]|uniref:Crp/Fnr family transcriptional regulator n=1 Tax=Xanthovirga aplysinae TaxID=2529853 RepID=UPI0012BD07F9|nr:Crp/Fnr family transcriptional regulator [Xanthovirga aplysinae]MTI30177.1 Crp/Fnr family transcriptional regulator [Xanthovirga aplysinae]